MPDLRIGDYCRARCGAPARYIGGGECLWVSAQDNELNRGPVGPGTPAPHLPHPTDDEIREARHA